MTIREKKFPVSHRRIYHFVVFRLSSDFMKSIYIGDSNLLHIGMEPWSPALEADALTAEPPGKPP